MQTQVGIIGAGPAGLLLSHILHLHGIESVVLEKHSKDYIESRVRAGVLEQASVTLLSEVGLGERLQREGMQHHGFEIRFGSRSHRINFDELTDGKGITVYGQQEVVKDIIAARLAAGGQISFEVDKVSIHNQLSEQPFIEYLLADENHKLNCDFIIGCDGFHGISRKTIPKNVISSFNHTYPFAWLGVLVQAPPSSEELIYSNSVSGFALHSMRSPTITRNYIQCPPDDVIEDWSNDRIWQELHARLETVPGWKLVEGKILEKGITPMRSFVCETMRHGRLYLAGDASHIVPPTGAKGMNLAISDIRFLSQALSDWYRSGSEDLLNSYSANCLRRVWQGERFSWYMTSLLHTFPDDNRFQHRLQQAELDYLSNSKAASAALAESYVGYDF
ncbi:MAG: 4-hydroxybenzoate 3-monooxygenase [Pseudomonadota bacterium]|nr:4-hydroxybenzoate 3-monooxygenase [Pseudomonadota bacterium]